MSSFDIWEARANALVVRSNHSHCVLDCTGIMVASIDQHCFSLACTLCLILFSFASAIPRPSQNVTPLYISSNEQIMTTDDGPINTNLTGPSVRFVIHSFDASAIPMVTGPDCREALQHLRYARGIQVFSMHPANGENPVPSSWYGGNCEIRLGLLDPQAKPANLRIPPQLIGESASAVVRDCVSNTRLKKGGVTQLVAAEEFPSPWGVFVFRRGSLPGGSVMILPSNTTGSGDEETVTGAGTDHSRRTVTPSYGSALPNPQAMLESRSDFNLTSPSSSSSTSPRCFSRQVTPLPITIQDCWPAIHNMMTADNERLWHHPVRWGGITGQPVPRVFFSQTCKITVASTARPAVDVFSLEEAGNNIRWLMNSCRDFHGGTIGVGTSGAFFVEVEANGPALLDTVGENVTMTDGASAPPVASLDSSATA